MNSLLYHLSHLICVGLIYQMMCLGDQKIIDKHVHGLVDYTYIIELLNVVRLDNCHCVV